MTPTPDLAAALEQIAKYRAAPGPERDACNESARRLRALEAVRVAAAEWDGICDENCARKRARSNVGCSCGAEALRQALAGVE